MEKGFFSTVKGGRVQDTGINRKGAMVVIGGVVERGCEREGGEKKRILKNKKGDRIKKKNLEWKALSHEPQQNGQMDSSVGPEWHTLLPKH